MLRFAFCVLRIRLAHVSLLFSGVTLRCVLLLRHFGSLFFFLGCSGLLGTFVSSFGSRVGGVFADWLCFWLLVTCLVRFSSSFVGVVFGDHMLSLSHDW